MERQPAGARVGVPLQSYQSEIGIHRRRVVISLTHKLFEDAHGLPGDDGVERGPPQGRVLAAAGGVKVQRRDESAGRVLGFQVKDAVSRSEDVSSGDQSPRAGESRGAGGGS